MDQLYFRTDEELVGFFSKNKTRMSCIKNPNIFLSQLRDYKLVSEDLYQEVIKMRNKKTKQSDVYKILEGVEKMGGQFVKSFWRCVFQDHIQSNYSIFFTLQKELLDSSFKENQTSAEQPSRDKEAARQGTMQNEEKVVTKSMKSDNGIDEAKSGTSPGSSQMKPAKKSSLLNERETLPVTCNQKKSVMYPDVTSYRDSESEDACAGSFRENQPSAEQPSSYNEAERPGMMQNQEKVVTESKKSDKEYDEAKSGTSSGSSQVKPANKSCAFRTTWPTFMGSSDSLLLGSFRENQPSAEQPSSYNEAERPGMMQNQEKVVTESKKSDKEYDEAKSGTSSGSSQVKPANKSCAFRTTWPTFMGSSDSLLLGSFRENQPSAEQPSSYNEAERPGMMQNQEKVVTESKKSDKEYDEAKSGTSSGSSQVKPANKSCAFRTTWPTFMGSSDSLLLGSFRETQPSAEQPSSYKEAERPGMMQNQEKVVTESKKSDNGIDEAKSGTSSGSSQMKPAKKSSLLYKRKTLPVTCNQEKGVLYPAKLATGVKCILSEDKWFSPPEFERFSGKERCKNWKTSIRYRKTPLQTFIKDGRLKSKRYYRGRVQKIHNFF